MNKKLPKVNYKRKALNKKLKLKPQEFHVFRNRYKKHFPPFPSALCVDYMSSDLAVREYGLRLTNNVYAYDEEKLYSLVGYDSDFKKIGRYFVRKFVKNPKYLDRLVKWSEQNKNSLKNYLEENFKPNELRFCTNRQLWKKLNEYVRRYRHFHLINTPAWWIGSDFAEAELKKSLRRLGNAEEIFGIITDPAEFQTENLLEELSLACIVSQAKKLGVGQIEKGFLPKPLKRMLAIHTAEFSYIPFGYNTGIIWDQDYFIRKINKTLRRKNVIGEKEILQKIRNRVSERKKKTKGWKLTKKELLFAKSLRQLAYLQELKKATQTKSHPLLHGVVYKELSRRLKTPIKFFDYMTYSEIESSLKNGISPFSKREIKQRFYVSAVIMENLQYRWIYGNDVKELLKENNLLFNEKEIKSIKGIIASRGKTSGKVSICLFSTQINKVKQGNVLVTAMTTPDFVPAMKKAAAIITDEGGITSHAAIVSRELKKPCVIGTKIATKVLKNGDLVEVDANKGVVRILKRA